VTEHDIFVSAEPAAGEVRAVIEAEPGSGLQRKRGPDPVPALAAGTTQVFFHDSHPFEDDRDFAVSRYRYWISGHDSARDQQRQLAVAQRIFDAVKARGWPVMLSFDLQGSIAVYP